jgi:hypothetical protein
MVFSRFGLIAVAMTPAVACATASTVPDRSLFEGENSTTTLTEPRSLLEYDPKTYSLCGVDLVGGDIWQAQHKEPDLCVTNCLASTGCDAATWTNFNGGTCFFKRLQGSWANSVPKVGAISFMRVESNTEYMGPNFPANMDMPGNDFYFVMEYIALQRVNCDTYMQSGYRPLGNDGRSVPAPTLDECNRALRLSPYTAYTWTNYNGGTCWLKTRASPYVYSPGAISRYARSNMNPNMCL